MVLMYYVLFTNVHGIGKISINMIELYASSNIKPLHIVFENYLQN